MAAIPPFRATVAEVGGQIALVSVSGELDLYVENELRDALASAAALNVTTVVVDVSGVSFLDSTACGILVTEAKRMRREKRGSCWARTATSARVCSGSRGSTRSCPSTRPFTPRSRGCCWWSRSSERSGRPPAHRIANDRAAAPGLLPRAQLRPLAARRGVPLSGPAAAPEPRVVRARARRRGRERRARRTIPGRGRADDRGCRGKARPGPPREPSRLPRHRAAARPLAPVDLVSPERPVGKWFPWRKVSRTGISKS